MPTTRKKQFFKRSKTTKTRSKPKASSSSTKLFPKAKVIKSKPPSIKKKTVTTTKIKPAIKTESNRKRHLAPRKKAGLEQKRKALKVSWAKIAAGTATAIGAVSLLALSIYTGYLLAQKNPASKQEIKSPVPSSDKEALKSVPNNCRHCIIDSPTPTPPPAENGYRRILNGKYQISLMYPQEWSQKNTDDRQETIAHLSRWEQTDPNDPQSIWGAALHFSVQTGPEYSDLEETAKELLFPQAEMPKASTTTVGGRAALKYPTSLTDQSQQYAIIFELRDRNDSPSTEYGIIRISISNKNQTEVSEQVEAILNSIKFNS